MTPKSENSRIPFRVSSRGLLAWFAVHMSSAGKQIAKALKSPCAVPPGVKRPPPVSYDWVMVSPDGIIDRDSYSTSPEICWDKACWPAYRREHLESEGWRCVRVDRKMQETGVTVTL
jgi:hypothetical protein